MKHVSQQTQSAYLPTIIRLRVKNQRIISRYLDLDLIDEVKQLKKIDEQLVGLLHKAINFDFVGEVAEGKTLLVGEGNLSFSVSLAKRKRINPYHLTATTFEKVRNLPSEAIENTEKLKDLGVLVLHGVNATRLSATLGTLRFDNIIFQFPHTGSREPIEGHNPNFILIRDFLISAKHHITQSGKVLISAVDNPHYRGAFQFDDAAEQAGFQQPEMYPFNPSLFLGYVHSMTHEDGSALNDHKKFGTWVFKL